MFCYVEVTGKGCEGWINLFYDGECIALIQDKALATSIKSTTNQKVLGGDASHQDLADQKEKRIRAIKAFIINQFFDGLGEFPELNHEFFDYLIESKDVTLAIKDVGGKLKPAWCHLSHRHLHRMLTHLYEGMLSLVEGCDYFKH